MDLRMVERGPVSGLRNSDAAMRELKDYISNYDALFMDLNMPAIDGSALVAWVRQTGFRDKVAVLSGNITAEVEAQLKTVGEVVLLQKPFEFDRIKGLLGSLWSEKKPARVIRGHWGLLKN